MFQVLVIVRDSNNNVVPSATASFSISGLVSTDASGTATLPLPGTVVGQSVLITASANGYTPSSQSYLVAQFTGVVTFNLSPAASPLTAILTITDGTNPISGASIFINGGSPVSTSELGSASITLSTGSNQIQVTAPNFQTYNASINASSPPDHIVLSANPNGSGNQILTLVSSPPASTLQIASEGGLLGSDGTYTTQNAFAPGSYPVTLTSPAGQTSTTNITVVSGQTTYQLTPVATTDSGSGSSLQTVATDGSSAAAPTSSQPGTVATSNAAQSSPSVGTGIVQGTGSSVPDYEFINPLGNFGRYFTATQARMYIGNLFIEELAGCQFVLQGNKVPIYGYASEAFDAIGTGKYLVQGQIMVHFISEGYLYTVLNEYKKTTGTSNSTSVQAFQNLMATQQQLQASNSSDPTVQKQIASIQKQRQQLLASDPTLASSFKRTTLTNSTTVVGPNAVYRNTPFDLVLELEGGGRTVTRKIFNCVLTSNEQIYGDSDTPLLDSYSFIGRRLQ